ncbi:MAG: hypothetical protein ACRCTP_04175 [Aeromonas popoffii]|uniref:hypothetical protein n=1 Tax=Aeromonas popoffii TaxID=70856 RepID=UPI003F2B0935
MQHRLVISHPQVAKKFVFDNFDDGVSLSEVYSRLEQFFEENSVTNKFSSSSLRRMIKESVQVKGWDFVIENPTTAMVQIAERQVIKRDEKRRDKKFQKIAEKNARRSLKNGNRKHLGAQKAKPKPVDGEGPQKRLVPSAIAMSVMRLIR